MTTEQLNPFPMPSALELVLLSELVKVARTCYGRGWSYGTAGNFSLRGRGGIVWQSPSGLNKGALNPTQFIPIDLSTATVIWPAAASPVRPSQEMAVHLGIYRADPCALTVVHTHPPHLVRQSRSGEVLVFQGEEMQKHLGCADHLQTLRLPVLPNPTPAAMPALTQGVAGHIVPGVPLVILAGHGVYAWAKTPMEALSFIEAAEFLCQTRGST